MRRTIGNVAKLSGTSVRTLHHYDEIGLLKPSARTPSGYRHYSEADLERLRQILFYRELAFPLREIGSLLDRESNPIAHLAKQRDLLAVKMARLQAVSDAIDSELEARRMGIALNADERLEVFGEFKPALHAEEARARWGETEAFNESTRRTSRYDKEAWLTMQRETEAIEQGFGKLLAERGNATSSEAMNLAEAHRLSICRWFYDCDLALHRELADMYVDDPRFAAHYKAIAPGLSTFIHDATHANAVRTLR